MDRTQCSMWVAAAHARGPLSVGVDRSVASIAMSCSFGHYAL